MTGQLYPDSLMRTEPIKEMVSPFGIGRINKLIIQDLIHEEFVDHLENNSGRFLYQKMEII